MRRRATGNSRKVQALGFAPSTTSVSLCFAGSLLFALCSVTQAQQQKVPRVGYVSQSGNSRVPGPQIEGFRQGLRDLQYIEGKNILVEYRYVDGKLERIPAIIAELLELKVDMLVVSPLTAVRAAKRATVTTPIVIVATFDPVAAGIVDTLARPGGNITGVARLTRELSGKRLELLKEVVPGISRIGLLGDADAPGPAIALKEYELAARVWKIQLQPLKVRGPNPDLEGAFQRVVQGRANGLITVSGILLNRYSKRIAELAIKNRLPSLYEADQYVEAGGLLSYSASDAEQFRRAAMYVDRILKGAQPADLPIEQPTKFDLVINLKTAKQIGVTIPPAVLARADRVIK
jgi:putative ABC transport system substrate-binding protein